MLRSLGHFSFRLLLVTSWVLVLGGFLLLVVEESGMLAELLRANLKWRLGTLGEGLTIERVSLRWFEPGVVLEDVSLRAPAAGGRQGAELLRLREVHLSFHPDWESRRPVRQLYVKGGRVRISDTLFEGLDHFGTTLSEEGAEGSGWGPKLSPPPFAVDDFEIEIELPDGSLFDLGTVHLLARKEEGGYRLSGALVPVLEGAVPEPVEIFIDGRQWESGIELSASASNVPLASKTFRIPELLGTPPIEETSGRLSLDATGRLELGPKAVVQGTLRARFDQGRLLMRPGDPWFENLRGEVEARFHPGEDGELWERDSWTASSRFRADWNETPIEAWGEYGSEVRGGWAHVWARAHRLPLAESTLAALGALETFREPWEAFSPNGVADASMDVVLRRLAETDGPPTWEKDLAVHVRHIGESGMTFHGFDDLEGGRAGIPIPTAEMTGETVFLHDDRRPRPYRLALIDAEAKLPGGLVRGWSSMVAPEAGRPDDEPEFDLVFEIPAMAVDDRLRAAFEQSSLTREIWPAYDPRGGTMSSEWRFRQGPETKGLTAAGKIEVEDTTLRWFELPVPVSGISGEMTMLWAAEPSVLLDVPGKEDYREFGVHYTMGTRDAAGPRPGIQLQLTGFGREENLPDVVRPADIPFQWVQGLAIEIDELLLRGKDWDVLASVFPDLRLQVLELGARGGMRVSFEGSRHRSDGTYVSDVEAVPNVVEVTPLFFQRRTRNLAGRVLVRTESFEDEAREDEYESRFALSAGWPDGAELAARGHIPVRGPADIRVQGAGIDATNMAFRGALVRTLTEEETGVAGDLDLSESKLYGRLDFSVLSNFLAESEAEAENDYRIFLRHNTLEHATLRLKDLHGTLSQSADILRGPVVYGHLGDHPIELRNVLVFALESADEVVDADPRFLRGGFVTDEAGLAIQAELHTENLPLDETHLSNVLAPEALDVLRESVIWHGELDVEGARILFTTSIEGQEKFSLHGAVKPHDLSMRLGFPIEISNAEVDIKELVVEDGRARGWGEIVDLDARIAERELADADMIFVFVDKRLTIDNLSGAFEGGILESLGGEGQGARKALGIDLAEPYRFDVAIRMRNVHVDRLLKGVFQSSIADAGLLDVSVQLSGTPGEVLGLSGRGQLRLSEGRLWSIPTMRELFTQLGFPNTAVFDRMRARFQLRNGKIKTSFLEVKSALLNLVGSGELDLDGRVHYDMEVRYSLLDKLGIFNRVLYWLNNSLWRVALRGSFSRPKVLIRKPLLELFREVEDTPPRALPLPSFAPLGRRF